MMQLAPGRHRRSTFLPPVGGRPSSRVRLSPDQTRGDWLGCSYGRDDIVNGGAGRGGVGFIVNERLVRGGLGDTVDTVGRHAARWSCPSPFRVVAGIWR